MKDHQQEEKVPKKAMRAVMLSGFDKQTGGRAGDNGDGNGELLYGSEQDGQGRNDCFRGTVGFDMSRGQTINTSANGC